MSLTKIIRVLLSLFVLITYGCREKDTSRHTQELEKLINKKVLR